MLNKELADLWDESLQDEDFRFELKAQDIAVKLASAVAQSGITPCILRMNCAGV